MNWHVCWEEETKIVLTIEAANEMDSVNNIAAHVKSEREVANEMKV